MTTKHFSRMAAGLALAAGLCGALHAQSTTRYTISTFAGNGASGFEGDGSAAAAAKLNSPIGLAIDSSGNVYIADQLNHRIRKVSTSGTISTIAGKDVPGSTGNDGPATDAALNNPSGVAVDSAGNVYIADTTNHRIRKVGTDGKITAFAGDGTAGFLERDSLGELLAAKDAQLNQPLGIALDSAGNLYIADAQNHVIRKVGTDGKISTVAGNGVSGYSGDDGVATNASLNHPTGIAVGSGGSLYIADQMNHKIRKVTPDGNIRTLAGIGTPGFNGNGGPANYASLFYPTSVAVDASGNVFITDMTNNRIRRVAEDGTISVIAGTGRFGDSADGELAANARMKFPTGILAASGGRVFFTDSQNSRVKLLTPIVEPPTAEGRPVIAADGVGLAAEFGAARRIAPGAWVEIQGSGFAADSTASTRVTIDGQAAVVTGAEANRLKVQAPFSLAEGERNVVVSTVAGESDPYRVQVSPAEPGIEAPAALRVDDRQFASARIGDSDVLAVPEGAVAGLTSRPAKAGETLRITGTGFGAVTPYIEAGEPSKEGSALVLPVRFFLGDRQAEAAFAGLAPGTAGVYEFKLVVPEVTESGPARLRVVVDGKESAQAVFVAVEK